MASPAPVRLSPARHPPQAPLAAPGALYMGDCLLEAPRAELGLMPGLQGHGGEGGLGALNMETRLVVPFPFLQRERPAHSYNHIDKNHLMRRYFPYWTGVALRV